MLLFFVPAFVYSFYDYMSLKSDRMELALLRKETQEQQKQIEGLAAQITVFSQRMEYLKQLEKKIRTTVNVEEKRKIKPRLGIGGPENVENRLKSQMGTEKNAVIAGIRSDILHLAQEATDQENSFKELLDFFQKQKMMQAARPTFWPVRGWVTSEFGYRLSPFTNEREFHQGIDVAAGFGARIVAPADGMVTEASYHSDLGNAVKIDNGYGITTCFGHLSRIAVTVGAKLKKGDIIGYIGSTGRSTGPHLHYSVSLKGASVNPRKYLH